MVQQQQRAIETKEQLLSAAAEVFGRQGYRATTLNDILGSTNLTQGALYFHFKSKVGIAEEILRRQHELSNALGASFLQSGDGGLVSIVRLSGALAAQILTEPIVRAGLRLGTESAEDLPGAAAPYRDWIEMAHELLRRADTEGDLRPGLNLEAAAELVISAFTGTQFVSAALSGSADLLERLERLWPVLLGGMAGDPAHPAVARASELVREGASIRTDAAPRGDRSS